MKFWIYGVGACVIGIVFWWVNPGDAGGNAGGTAEAGDLPGRHSRPERSPRHLSGESSTAKRITTLDGFVALKVEDWLDEDRRPQLMADLIRWSEDHPREAVGFLARVPAAVRDEVACALAGSLMGEQSELAWSILVDLPPSPVSQAMIQQLAMEYVEKSPDEALAWALALEDAGPEDAARDRDAVVAAVLTAYSSAHPEKAMGLVTANLKPGSMRDKTIVEIVQRWTQSDPGAAAAHVLTMQPGEAREAALENLIRIWGASRPDEARAWVLGLGDSGMRAKAESFLPPAPPD